MDRHLIGLVDSLENHRPEAKPVPDEVGHLLKRRLLGAAVLVALAVIFLPLVLDGSGSESRFRRVEQLRVEPPRIIESGATAVTQPEPTKPVVAIPTPAPTANPVVSNPVAANPVTSNPLPANPAPETTAPVPVQPATPSQAEPVVSQPVTAPVADDAALQAWIIQAGSFSDQANALIVRDQLRTAGHPAFVSMIDTANGAFYRVNVGPLSDRAEALKIQTRVQQELRSDTIIRQYP